MVVGDQDDVYGGQVQQLFLSEEDGQGCEKQDQYITTLSDNVTHSGF
jgi:hypothetical protein